MLRTLFFLTLMTVGTAAAFWNRFAALLLYVWFALFRPLEWIWIDLSALRLSLVLGILLVVPCFLTGILPAVAHPLSIGAILLFLASLAAQTNAVNPEFGWLWIDQFGRLILVSLLATTLLNTPRRVMLLIAVIAGSIAFHSAKAGVGALLTGGVQYMAGLAGAFIDNNGYALAIAMSLPLMWATWQYFRDGPPLERWAARGFFFAVPLSMLTIAGLMSRSGFLALVTAILSHVMLQRRRFSALVIIALVATLALPFAPLPEGYLDRLETIRTYEEEQETSALGRLHFWRVAMDMVADYPLGIGLKNFEFRYDEYDTLGGAFGRGRSSHSSHFQVLAELGYFAALVWCLMFVYAFFAALRARRISITTPDLSEDERRFFFIAGNALVVSMVAFVVGGAFIALALNDLTWYSFAIVAAVDRMAVARQEASVSARLKGRLPDFAFPRQVARA
jgi:putative inorganic carbon (HCO3(-)) transporter